MGNGGIMMGQKMKQKKIRMGIIMILVLNFSSAFADEPQMQQVIINGKRMTKEEKAAYDHARALEIESSQRQAGAEDAQAHRDSFKSIEVATTAAATPAQVPAEECKNFKDEMKRKVSSEFSEKELTPADGFPGSPDLQWCNTFTKGTMKNIYKGGKSNFNWEEVINDKCLSAKQDECDVNKLKECVKKLIPRAARCDAAAFLISASGREWKAEFAKAEKKSGGNNPVIECKTSGVETLDYEPCVKFITNSDIMDVVQTGIQGGQELYYKDKVMTAQADAAASTDTATAALKAQGSSLKAQQDVMTQRAALDAGKLAALASYYSDIPGPETIAAKCDSYNPPESAASYADFSRKTCTFTAQAGNLFDFLPNQQMKEKMKLKLMALGVNVGTDAMQAALAAKQVGAVNDAIAKVQAFKVIDPTTAAADNLTSTYCQQNPGVAKCLTGNLDKTFDALTDNVINFGDGGTGTAYTNTPAVIATGGTTDSTGGGGGSGSAPGIGGVITAAPQNGGLVSVAPEAKVTKGTAPGGGGGGGGGGGSTGGGGGGGAPAGQPQGGTSAAIQGKTPNYGGGTGTLSMMGGYGINKNKTAAKEDANPFGKLFNKDGKSGAVNFREIASEKVGGKKDNIFEMISNRYTTVNKDKRLLEYELTK